MGKRVFNFNAGPAALPLPVLEEIQAEFLDYKGTGMSIVGNQPSLQAFRRGDQRGGGQDQTAS